MGTYEGWRKNGGPTLYGPDKTAVTADVLEAGLLFAAAILAFSLLIVLPGIRGKERWFTLIRILLGVFILTSILLVNFGQEWEVASVTTDTQYRAGLKGEIKVDVGVKIGLRSVNITLKGKPIKQELENGRVNETVNYNERFSWDNLGWTQGRIGFGPFSSTINQEFRAAQFKGLPYPILWIAEYFTIDGEGIRWGRFYRQAGFYTHILMWTAFPLWVLSMVLFYMVLRYGGYFMMMTGGCLLLGNILYATIRNPNDLIIPFKDGKLEFHWGWCFWLCLINGLICTVGGIIVFIMDLRYYEALATFFGVDVAQELEEFYADVEVTTSREQGRSEENGSSGIVDIPYEDVDQQPQYRRRASRATRQLLRTHKNKPRPPPRSRGTLDFSDDQLYENVDRDGTRSQQVIHRPNQGASNVSFQDDDGSRQRESRL